MPSNKPVARTQNTEHSLPGLQFSTREFIDFITTDFSYGASQIRNLCRVLQEKFHRDPALAVDIYLESTKGLIPPKIAELKAIFYYNCFSDPTIDPVEISKLTNSPHIRELNSKIYEWTTRCISKSKESTLADVLDRRKYNARIGSVPIDPYPRGSLFSLQQHINSVAYSSIYHGERDYHNVINDTEFSLRKGLITIPEFVPLDENSIVRHLLCGVFQAGFLSVKDSQFAKHNLEPLARNRVAFVRHDLNHRYNHNFTYSAFPQSPIFGFTMDVFGSQLFKRVSTRTDSKVIINEIFQSTHEEIGKYLFGFADLLLSSSI